MRRLHLFSQIINCTRALCMKNNSSFDNFGDSHITVVGLFVPLV